MWVEDDHQQISSAFGGAVFGINHDHRELVDPRDPSVAEIGVVVIVYYNKVGYLIFTDGDKYRRLITIDGGMEFLLKIPLNTGDRRIIKDAISDEFSN